jgi:GNAT superfamily N-acetyltransferase
MRHYRIMIRSSTHHIPDATVLLTRSYEHPDAQSLVQALYAEQRDLYGYADPVEADPANYQPPHGLFLVAYDSNQPVGCGGLHTFDPTTSTVEIKKMYTVPTYRGTGLGRRIIARLEEAAERTGARRIILETGIRNTAALSLYGGLGYRPMSSYMPDRDPQINRAFVKALRPE